MPDLTDKYELLKKYNGDNRPPPTAEKLRDPDQLINDRYYNIKKEIPTSKMFLMCTVKRYLSGVFKQNEVLLLNNDDSDAIQYLNPAEWVILAEPNVNVEQSINGMATKGV